MKRRELKQLVRRLGGVRATSLLTGRSRSTVRRWVNEGLPEKGREALEALFTELKGQSDRAIEAGKERERIKQELDEQLTEALIEARRERKIKPRITSQDPSRRSGDRTLGWQARWSIGEHMTPGLGRRILEWVQAQRRELVHHGVTEFNTDLSVSQFGKPGHKVIGSGDRIITLTRYKKTLEFVAERHLNTGVQKSWDAMYERFFELVATAVEAATEAAVYAHYVVTYVYRRRTDEEITAYQSAQRRRRARKYEQMLKRPPKPKKSKSKKSESVKPKRSRKSASSKPASGRKPAKTPQKAPPKARVKRPTKKSVKKSPVKASARKLAPGSKGGSPSSAPRKRRK